MKRLNVNLLMADQVPVKKERQVQIGDDVKSFILFKDGLPKKICLCPFHLQAMTTQLSGISGKLPEYEAVPNQRMCFLCNIAPYLISEQYELTNKPMEKNNG